MSVLDQNTAVWLESMYFFILGAGIGLIMQILTLIVQNTAEYRDLGTATSGVTFFRTLGGSFGAAVLGSIYSNNLADRLPAALAQSPGGSPAAATIRPRSGHCPRRPGHRWWMRTPRRCTMSSCGRCRSPCSPSWWRCSCRR